MGRGEQMRSRVKDLRCQADQPVPRHARGRTGRRRQHARRLSPRPHGFPGFLAGSGQGFAGAETAGAARLPRRSRCPRLQIVQRGAPAVGDAASVSLPAQRADSQRRSRGDPVRPEARPRPAEGAVDIRRRSDADARQGAHASAGSLCAAAASRAAAVLPARGALRHRPAGVGTGGAAAVGGAARRPHDRGARQGRQGTAGAAERGVAAGDGGLSCGDGSAEAREEEKRRRPRNGCFPRSARAGI